MPKYLSFVKGVVYIGDLYPLLSLNFNRENLQESKIIKVIQKKLVRKAIEILLKLAEKDESKEEKDDNIDNETKVFLSCNLYSGNPNPDTLRLLVQSVEC